MNCALALPPPEVAVSVLVAGCATAFVIMVKLAVVAPATTVAAVGSAAGLLLERLITSPAAAGPLSVTRPADV